MKHDMSHLPCKLSLWRLVKTDWAVCLLVFGPLFLFAVALIVFVHQEYPFRGYQWYEIVLSITAVLGASMMFWPFVAWWYVVAQKTVRCNIRVRATIIRVEQRKGPYFGVWYRFEHGGKEYNHIATLVKSKLTRRIANREQVEVYVDPDRNRSFIVDLVCRNGGPDPGATRQPRVIVAGLEFSNPGDGPWPGRHPGLSVR